MSSQVMIALQKQRIMDQIDSIVSWYSQKQNFFKTHIPLQQILVKNLKDCAELTILRINDLSDMFKEEKQISKWMCQRNQKCLLMNKMRYDNKSNENKDKISEWTKNIDRVCLQMSNTHIERINKLKDYGTKLENIHLNMNKQQDQYQSQLNKGMKKMQKLFDVIGRQEKQQTQLIKILLKEIKIIDKNTKDSVFFMSNIFKILNHLKIQINVLVSRNVQIRKFKQDILLNEDKITKKIKQLLRIFTQARLDIYQKGKNDDNITGLIAIMQEGMQNEKNKYLNNFLLTQNQLTVLKSLIHNSADLNNNLQLIQKYLSLNMNEIFQQLQVNKIFKGAISKLSHKQWNKVSLAEGWLISNYTIVQIFLTFDNLIAIFNEQNQLLYKIHLQSTTVSKVENNCLYLMQITKGFFTNSKQQYKLNFDNNDRLEEFKLFVENVAQK